MVCVRDFLPRFESRKLISTLLGQVHDGGGDGSYYLIILGGSSFTTRISRMKLISTAESKEKIQNCLRRAFRTEEERESSGSWRKADDELCFGMSAMFDICHDLSEI